MLCPKCGTSNDSSSSTCSKCGAIFSRYNGENYHSRSNSVYSQNYNTNYNAGNNNYNANYNESFQYAVAPSGHVPTTAGKVLSIISMSLGIASAVFGTCGFLIFYLAFSFGFIGLCLGIPALVLACIARSKNYNTAMTSVGFTLGIVGISLFFFDILSFFCCMSCILYM